MKRVLIVDDEILVRIGIRSLLEGSDYEIVGEAAGGREALELARRLRPDIVLTDLVMAEGDGLELVRALRGEGGPEAIIALSCRNDFDLVRQAMRAGADDYVFKLTLKTEELLETFSHALGRVRPGAKAEGSAGGADAMMDAPLGAGAPREDFSAAGEALLRGEEVGALGDSDFRRPYRLLWLDFESALGGEGDGAALAQLARELERAESAVLGSAAQGSRILLWLKNEGRGAAQAVFALAEEYGRRYLGRLPSGGLSPLGSSAAELSGLAASASSACDAAYRAAPALAFADDLDGGRGPSKFRPEDYAAACRSIRLAVEALDGEALLAAARDAIACLRSAEDRDSGRLRLLASGLMAPFRERAASLGFELDGSGGTAAAEAGLLASRGLSGLEEAMPLFAAEFLREARSRAGLRREIAQVKRWLLADLSRSFTVEQAAAVAGMSQSRFAHIWKQELGSSFIDYVNDARIERARELLATTDLLVREIADAVGVESLNHFGALFKRRFGCTPNEMRGKSPFR